jgi:hypothetical protein
MAVWNHSARAISPNSFNRIAPFMTSPNKQARLWVTTVTKYAPGWV